MKKKENVVENTVYIQADIDEKDVAILKLLEQNARTPVKEIADAIHLSPTPVHKRIRRLEQKGIIKHYTAIIDPGKLGKNLMVICYVSLRIHDKTAGAKFVKAIQNLSEVTECYSISGEFDFMLKILAANMDTYYDFHINKLSQVENMGHVQSVFVMGIVKQTHALL